MKMGRIGPLVEPRPGPQAGKSGYPRSQDTDNRDDSTAPWHLEDVVAVVGHCHELGQGRIPEDDVVRHANVRDVEVDELGAVVLVFAEGDWEADLPQGAGGVINDPRERLGGAEPAVGHMKQAECFHGEDIEAGATVNEGLGNLHVVDDW